MAKSKSVKSKRKPSRKAAKPKAKLLKVVVKRSRWLRGGLDGNGQQNLSQLRNKAGHMCCLGFACRAAGVSAKAITNKTTPSDLKTLPRALESLCNNEYTYADNTQVCSMLMSANDRSVSRLEREADLKDFGKQAGIAFTFVK